MSDWRSKLSAFGSFVEQAARDTVDSVSEASKKASSRASEQAALAYAQQRNKLAKAPQLPEEPEMVQLEEKYQKQLVELKAFASHAKQILISKRHLKRTQEALLADARLGAAGVQPVPVQSAGVNEESEIAADLVASNATAADADKSVQNALAAFRAEALREVQYLNEWTSSFETQVVSPLMQFLEQDVADVERKVRHYRVLRLDYEHAHHKHEQLLAKPIDQVSSDKVDASQTRLVESKMKYETQRTEAKEAVAELSRRIDVELGLYFAGHFARFGSASTASESAAATAS